MNITEFGNLGKPFRQGFPAFSAVSSDCARLIVISKTWHRFLLVCHYSYVAATDEFIDPTRKNWLFSSTPLGAHASAAI